MSVSTTMLEIIFIDGKSDIFLQIEDVIYTKIHGWILIAKLPPNIKLSIGDRLKQGEDEWEILILSKFFTTCFTGQDRNVWGITMKPLGKSPEYPRIE